MPCVRLVQDRKAALGAGLLRAFEPNSNAVGTAERMRKDTDCILVEEKDGVPAKYDGVAIWKKYQALKIDDVKEGAAKKTKKVGLTGAAKKAKAAAGGAGAGAGDAAAGGGEGAGAGS